MEQTSSTVLFNCYKNELLQNQCLPFSFPKVVHQLTEKCKQMHSELDEYATSQKEHTQLQENHTALLTGSQVLRSDGSIQNPESYF